MATNQDQRPRYYEDQYLGADDLDQAVAYGQIQQARHSLGAHTWGISIGLDLVEKSRPGGNRVDVFVTPGYAWDGYGRPIVLLAPAPVPESLFSDIKFDPQNANHRDGKGSLIKVWLQYDERSLRTPARGFESCKEGDDNSRIQETFRIVIGERGKSEQRGSVTINGAPVDPSQALTPFTLSGPARALYDESVPHQAFPSNDPPLPIWLIPIGYVRWLPLQNGLGSFVKRDDGSPSAQDPAKEPDSDVIRRFRRYVGVVAEAIEGAGGVIRLRDRFRDPGAVNFRPPVITTDPQKPPENDLVWVEGDLRVVGDARLAGGKLAFRAADGKDEGTPLEIRRSGGQQGGQGNRTLQVIIGPAGQDTNRFAVACIKPDQSVDQRLVVTSAGNVGIGTDTPSQKLTMQSSFGTSLEITPTSASLPWKSDGTLNEGAFVINQQSAGSQKADADFALMRDRKQRVILGDSDTLISSQDRGAQKGQLRFFLNREEAGEKEVMRINDIGNVGIGTTTPTGRLTLEGTVQPQQGQLSFFSNTGDMVYDGGDDKLFVFRNTNADGKTAFLGGNLGIGAANPAGKLTVEAAEHINVILDRTDTQDHMTLTVGSAGTGIHFSNSNRFFISTDPYTTRNRLDFGNEVFTILPNGNVGVGTPAPNEKLTVATLGGGTPVSAMSIDVGTFGTNANAEASYFFRARDLGAPSTPFLIRGDGMVFATGFVPGNSDGNLKTDITSLTDALPKLLRLRGVNFRWKEPEKFGHQSGRQVGLIAQEVEKIFPDWVTTAPNGYKALMIRGFEALVVEALRELHDEIEALTKSLAKIGSSQPEQRERKKREPKEKST